MRPSLFFAPSLTLSSHLRFGIRVRPVSSSLHATTTSTTRRADGTIIISPDDASRHSASVILCHGLGDTADGWAEPARYLASQLPHVKFILPTAPTQPVTMNMGMAMPSWYDIVGLDPRSNEACDGLDESADRIAALLEEEVVAPASSDDETTTCASPSLDYSRVVLAGFSQGGALALYAGMTQRRRGSRTGLGLAGILIMSGYLPRPKEFFVAPGSENTPILHCHGVEDPVVPVRATDLSRARVSSLVEEMGGSGNDLYEVKKYPGLEHSVSMEELDDVVAFLRRVVPPITAGNVNSGARTADPGRMSVRELRDAIRLAGLEGRAKGMFEKSELVDLLSGHLKDSTRKK